MMNDEASTVVNVTHVWVSCGRAIGVEKSVDFDIRHGDGRRHRASGAASVFTASVGGATNHKNSR